MAERISIIIEAIDNASEAIKRVGEAAKQQAAELRKLGGALTASGAALTAAAGFSVKAAAEQERAVTALAQAMRAVGTFSEEALARQLEFGGSLQRVTVFSDNAIANMQALLVSFGKLSGPQLEDATKATIGLASALGIDLDSAARRIALAIEGNAQGLGRFGVEVEKGATSQERLQAIMRVGLPLFEGAKAQAETVSGRMAQLGNDIGKLSASLGEALLPILKDLITNHLLPVVRGLTDWIQQHPQLAKQLVVLAAGVGLVMAVVGPFLLILPGLATAIGGVTAAVGILSGSLAALQAILLPLAAIAAAAFAGWQLGRALSEVTGLDEALSGPDGLFTKMFERLDQAKALWDGFVAKVQGAVEAVKGFFSGVFGGAETEAAVAPAGGAAVAPAGAIAAGGGTQLDTVAVQLQQIGEQAQQTSEILKGQFQSAFDAINAGLSNSLLSFANFNQFIAQKLGENWNSLSGAITNLTNTVVKTFHSAMSSALSAVILGTMSAKEAFKQLGAKMIEAVVNFLVELAVAKAISLLTQKVLTVSSLTMASTLAAAWAPVAAFVSLATFGANAAPAAAGIAATTALSAGIAAGVAALQVPQLQAGGIVTQPTLAVLGEEGPEAVIPLAQAGSLGMTVNVNIEQAALSSPGNIDEFVEDLTEQIGRLLERRQMMPTVFA